MGLENADLPDAKKHQPLLQKLTPLEHFHQFPFQTKVLPIQGGRQEMIFDIYALNTE